MRVSIRMGSNRMRIQIQKDTTCLQLLRGSLKVFRRPSGQQYSLFERVLGVERQVHANERIATILSEWSAKTQVEFIIRKCRKETTEEKSEKLNSQSVYRVYRGLKNDCDLTESHVYEQLTPFDELQPKRRKSIVTTTATAKAIGKSLKLNGLACKILKSLFLRRVSRKE